ncbi:MAG: class I SAM-dependent methyltransferase [Acidimicrobiia bacterium]
MGPSGTVARIGDSLACLDGGPTLLYDQRFYDELWEGGRRAAQLVLPDVIAGVSPTTIVDVGCGGGSWLSVAADLGVADLTGVDSAQSRRATSRFDAFNFIEADLARTLELPRSYDLAMSIEVAEHLPPERAEGFVADLTRLAPVVLFSAAYPGQGGTGHINEQWPSYWVERFAAIGYRSLEVCRATHWNDRESPMAIRTNMLLYVDSSIASRFVNRWPSPVMVDVVHPSLWDSALLQHRRAPHRLAGRVLREYGRAANLWTRRAR